MEGYDDGGDSSAMESSKQMNYISGFSEKQMNC